MLNHSIRSAKSHLGSATQCRGPAEVGRLVTSLCSFLKTICLRTNGERAAHWYYRTHAQLRSGAEKSFCETDMLVLNNRSSFVC